MRGLLAILLSTATVPAVAAPPSFTLIDLSPGLTRLGSFSDTAYGINGLGQVTGTYKTIGDPLSRGKSNGFRYTPGVGVVDIGNLGPNGVSAGTINNAGQIAGGASVGTNQGSYAAVFNPDGTVVNLGALGGSTSFSNGINDAGQVVGTASLTGNVGAHGFLYMPGSAGLTDLGTLGGTSSGASGINASGQFTGYSFLTGDTSVHAIFGSSKGLVDIGALPGSNPQASSGGYAINNAGEIVGYSGSSTANGGNGNSHAFAYTAASGMIDLGVFAPGDISAAYGLNNVGQIVGFDNHDTGNGNATVQAFLYDSGVLYRLSDLVTNLGDGVIVSAFAINDSGQIVGDALINGRDHAVILTPSVAAVPEPAAWTLSIAGFTMVGLAARRRQRLPAAVRRATALPPSG